MLMGERQMAEDGDRVDPVATELSRYKGLLKAQVLENERLREEVGKAMVLLNNVTAEMADAREEIREMNGRIDNLHWRGRV